MRSTKLQRGLNKFVASLIVVAIMAGCASTTISDRQQVANGYLPRPGQIWVYPFAATPADVPPESALAGQSSAGASAPTDQQIAEARQLGAAIAGQLVQQINNMGMSAAVASAATRPQLNDVVVEGSLLSVQQGSAGLR